MKPSLDVVILSNTINDKIYQTNIDCIKSLIDSEQDSKFDIHVILMESNKQSQYSYSSEVEIITPKEEFNYNRYMNIGIKASNSDFIAMCNNDILFSLNWFTEIVKFQEKNRQILSFSPFDPTNKYTQNAIYQKPHVHYGYGVRKEIAGWCIVVKREIFDIIGGLDETFDFYYADDDYTMTLRKYALKHVLLTTSEVRHLGGLVTKEVKINNSYPPVISENDVEKPEDGNSWLKKNPKAFEGHLKFHKKWGSMRKIALKNKFFACLPIFNMPTITKLTY